MGFIDLIRREGKLPFAVFISMGAALALADVLILVIINQVVWSQDIRSLPPQYPLLFALFVAGRHFAQGYVLQVGGDEIMRVIHQVRIRLIEKVRRIDMKSAELTDQSNFLINTVSNVSAIGYLSFFVAILFKDVLQVLFIALYIYTLSPAQFVIVAAMMAVIAMTYWEAAHRIDGRMQAMQHSDEHFLNVASELLNGFREAKMNRRLSDAINAEIGRVSKQSYLDNCSLRTNVLKGYGSAELILFVFLGALIFIEPRFTDTPTSVVIQVAVAVTFIFGVVREAMGTSTEFMILGRIAGALTDLERQLDKLERDEPEVPPQPITEPVRTLELRGVTYDNIDVLAKTRFTVGPADMALKGGEIVFLTGSNGSGKSTLLRVVCGLYGAHAGDMVVNGETIGPDQLARYRSLFSVVFADHYLFSKLYGAEVDQEKVDRLLDELGLTGKTELKDGTFSTLRLSSGQRTRVALIIAMLEDRPVYVFDEWAADQDPYFRERFYHHILPGLRDQGKLVIAVTHDKEFFGCCDRLFDVRTGVPHEMAVC
ncbi:ATP-binding cassette domain-containing protein [Azospirillum sp. sgz302134]